MDLYLQVALFFVIKLDYKRNADCSIGKITVYYNLR